MTTPVKLGGVYAPITTPFDARGDVDAQGAAANCRAVIAAGVNGIVVCGSTGEAPLLDERERAALLGAVRSAVSNGQVLMGIGAESTRHTIERAKAAAANGADVGLCVAPHYFGAGAMNDDALRAHYRAVADASPIPVALYTIPKYMHFALSAGLVGELAQHPNIIGIKDSSGDPAIFAGYLPAQSASFSVITGNATQFLNALRSGARGGILAAADFAPALAREIFDAHTAGKTDTADALQARMGPLGTDIVAKIGISGVKAACDIVGLVGGKVRAPLRDIDAAGRTHVASLLKAAGVGPVPVKVALAS
jgi:dihydrodipicolinate synthase/N-acetylneuraminate lyase